MNNPVSRYLSNVKHAAGAFVKAGEAAGTARRVCYGIEAADKVANEIGRAHV